MKILVINCGSSSCKYQFIDMDNEEVLAKGLCERIGIDGKLVHDPIKKEKVTIEAPMPDHTAAVQMVIEALLSKEHGVIDNVSQINAVGHRVVHGGEFFSDSCLIDEEVKQVIDKCSALAPLHNPPNIIGINACEKLMPNVPQVAVFDTSFHQTMPEHAYLYAIDYALYEKHKIRRYGFHGTSHRFVSERAAEMLEKPLGKSQAELKIVTCHLGNGASVCAVCGGKSVDTSMGFTPLEGLAMGTRSGDIDPAVISFICASENISPAQVDNILNKKSGVLGVSGVSSDFRDVEAAIFEGNKRAKAALNIFNYRVAKYIASYAAAMNGIDAVVFTAGIGENSAATREGICDYLGFLGVAIDKEKNNCRGVEIDFSSDGAKVRSLVIPTNEELVIARDTKVIAGKILTNK